MSTQFLDDPYCNRKLPFLLFLAPPLAFLGLTSIPKSSSSLPPMSLISESNLAAFLALDLAGALAFGGALGFGAAAFLAFLAGLAPNPSSSSLLPPKFCNFFLGAFLGSFLGFGGGESLIKSESESLALNPEKNETTKVYNTHNCDNTS